MPNPTAARAIAVAALSALLTSCAALRGNTQGPLQPQTVTGPCQVKPFFFLGLRSVPAQLSVTNTGEACTLLLVNPALNVVVDAALLTGPAQHGRATAGLTPGARQAVITYVPAPAYRGPDRFDITLEPGAVGVTFNVVVGAPG